MYRRHCWSDWNRSSHRKCSVKKAVLENFGKFTRKHLCQSLFFNEAAGTACNFIKKETVTQVFFCEFSEIFKNTFLTEQLCTTASAESRKAEKSLKLAITKHNSYLHISLRERVQTRSFFWSVFSRIRTRRNSVFGHFTQCLELLFWVEIPLNSRSKSKVWKPR